MARPRLGRIIGTIPGHATEIRYRRTGAQAGPYFHPFKPGVKMYALNDGSVLMKGARRIHAVDSEPGFWERFGHGRKGENSVRRVSTGRRRRRRATASQSSPWLWAGLAFLLLRGMRTPTLYTWINAPEQGGDGTIVIAATPPGTTPPWREASQYEISASHDAVTM